MKQIYILLLLFFTTSLIAQDELDGVWYLHYVNVDGENLMHNGYESLSPTIIFDIENSTFEGSVCNSYWANYSYEDNNQINIAEGYVSHTLSTCGLEPFTNQYEGAYFYNVLNNGNGNTGALELNYIVEGENDNATLTLVNLHNNNFAFYGREPLPNPLEGTWHLQYLINDYQQLNNTFDVTLHLTNETTSYNQFIYDGQSSCNSYSGLYSIGSNNRIKPILVESTDLDCSEDQANEFEQTYFSILYYENSQNIKNFEIINTQPSTLLVLIDENENQLVYGSIANTPTIFGRWNLTAIEENGVITELPIGMNSNINFTTETYDELYNFNGRGGFCNEITGAFDLGTETITTSMVGITLADCGPGELADFEWKYYSILENPQNNQFDIEFSEDGFSLFLTNSNGDKLYYGRETLSIADVTKKIDAISLAKNPVITNLQLSIGDLNIQNIDFNIYSIAGKLMHPEFKLDSNHSIDFGALSSGIYFLTVNYQGKTKSLKFIKQ